MKNAGRMAANRCLAGRVPWLVLALMAGQAQAADGIEDSAGLTAACAEYPAERQADARALAAASGKLEAGMTGDGAVDSLWPGAAVRVGLQSQREVSFVAPPGRRTLDEGAFAGIVPFRVPTGGTWRIGLDHPAWVDVVGAKGALVESSGFGGVRDCPAMIKVVEFPLEAGVDYRLQLSGAAAQIIGVILSGPAAVLP